MRAKPGGLTGALKTYADSFRTHASAGGIEVGASDLAPIVDRVDICEGAAWNVDLGEGDSPTNYLLKVFLLRPRRGGKGSDNFRASFAAT